MHPLTWPLLCALRIVPLALEGDDPADRTRVVADLVSVAGDAARAVEMWRQLMELSAGYAQVAATVDRAMLCRELGLSGLARFGAIDTGPIDREVEQPTVRVSETDPQRLGVHPAIEVGGVEDGLPSYVERDIDGGERGLRAVLARAAERGGFVLLVGGSSVGKTRSAYEAVRTVLPDWSLVHPAGPEEAAALARQPLPRTVVWLDELQRYLAGERGLTGGVVRALLDARSPTVLVATLWPERYLAFTESPDDGTGAVPPERVVVQSAHVAVIPPVFSASEQTRAEAAAVRDRRLAAALGTAGYGLTQTLAAGPQLVRHWELARTAHPFAWAVLAAALDVNRLGAKAPIPGALLRAAAPAYCTDRQRAEAPADWFKRALEYATRRLRGAAATLTPAGGTQMGETVGYVVADYLVQHVGAARHAERVPAAVWDAVVEHLTDTTDLVTVAGSASDRLLYRYAIPLYRRAADSGNRRAADQWTAHVGDPAGLRDLRARVLADGDGTYESLRATADAADYLADGLVRLGHWDELYELRAQLRAAEAARSWDDPMSPLPRGPQGWLVADPWAGDEPHDLDDRAGTRAGNDRCASAGSSVAIDYPSKSWTSFDDWFYGPPDEWEGPRAEAVMAAPHALFERYRNSGDIEGQRRLAEAHPGVFDRRLLRILANRGDLDGLAALAQRADDGLLYGIAKVFVHRDAIDELRLLPRRHRAGVAALADVLADRGELDRLEQLAAGEEWAEYRLIRTLTARGDVAAVHGFVARHPVDETARFGTGGLALECLNTILLNRGAFGELAQRAEAGDTDAESRLAEARAARDNLRTLRARSEGGDANAEQRLYDALVACGDADGLRARAEQGDDQAAYSLVEILVDRDDLAALRGIADAGDDHAQRQLADVLADRGYRDELTIRADRGDDAALGRLADLLANRGDVDTLRRRAHAGDTHAARRWVEMAADRGELEALQARADAGDFHAAERLAEMLVDRSDIDGLWARADTGDHEARSRLALLLVSRAGGYDAGDDGDDRDDEGAIEELRARADAGDWPARSAFARYLAGRNRVGELRERADRHPEDTAAAARLVDLLLHQGHLAEVHRVLLAQASLGARFASHKLPVVLLRLGRRDEARRVARYGLDLDGSPAAPW